MIDILAAGMSAVQTLRKRFPEMILHGHRAGHGAQTVFPEIRIQDQPIDLRHGVSMKAWTLLARLAGIDQLHIGAPKGKMEAAAQTVLENREACFRPLGSLKPMRPICSGGLKATVMWDVAKIMNPIGTDADQTFIFQAGGGTHSHDLGTFGGARSMVQARDAIRQKKSMWETIASHFETMLAFRKWEPTVYRQWIRSLTPTSRIVVTPDLRPYGPTMDNQFGAAPASVDLLTAIRIYPPLLADLQRENPSLLGKS